MLNPVVPLCDGSSIRTGQVLRFDKSLTGTDLDSDQEQTSLLKRLEWAVSRIDVNRLKEVMPAVGMNIACCLENSRSKAK